MSTPERKAGDSLQGSGQSNRPCVERCSLRAMVERDLRGFGIDPESPSATCSVPELLVLCDAVDNALSAELDRGEAIANEKRESAKSSSSPRSSSVPDYLAAYWETLTRIGEHDEVAVQRHIWEQITGEKAS